MINRKRPRNRTSLLRWMFQRGQERLICQVDRGRGFTLSVRPRTGARRTLIERFDDSVQAFQRHAQIASELRQFGWTLASYGR